MLNYLSSNIRKMKFRFIIFCTTITAICRKPSYHLFDADTFDACVGATFNYDVQNTNATAYQWKKNDQDVVGQTTGVLN